MATHPRPTRAATMRDVAAAAGVSLKSVSRVVNGEPNVSPDLARRVGSALESLGYRQNLGASALKHHRGTRAIGVLVQDVANDFAANALRAIEDRCSAHGLAVLAASLDEEPEREHARVADLLSRRVTGLVLMPATSDQSYLRHEIERGLPVVVFDREAEHIELDSVVVDNIAGARRAIGHLLDHGHRRIGLLADSPHVQTSERRLAGAYQALRERGMAVDPELVVSGVRTQAEARAAAHHLLGLADPPTALFAARNVITLGAAQALHDRGESFTRALLGFDEVSAADLLRPGLSVIAQHPREIGACAADLLLSRLDGYRGEARRVVIDVELVGRGSGEIPGPFSGERGGAPRRASVP